MAYKRKIDEHTYNRTNNIRKQADTEYDEYEYEDEYDDELASKRASVGCLIAVLVVVLIIAGVALYFWIGIRNEINGKNATAPETVVMDVESGYGGTTIGNLLEENGLIKHANIFRFYVRINGENDFQAGRFYIEPGMSYDEIIETLSQPPPPRETVWVTIPEGSTVFAFSRIFEEAGLCTAAEFVAAADNLEAYSDINFIKVLLEEEAQNPAYRQVFHRSEGYLYPDSYEFYADDELENIIRVLYETMDDNINALGVYDVMGQVGQELRGEPLTLHDTMIIASIIQAESGYVDYGARVSAVVWGRLGPQWADDGTLGMDTTLEYAMKYMQVEQADQWGDVPRSQISPQDVIGAVGQDMFYAYNTRLYDGVETRIGLPTGPVCSPPAAAIEAALNPDTSYLNEYFYFNHDKYGTHFFSRTNGEHAANVEQARLNNEQYDREQAEAAAASSETEGGEAPPEGEVA